ncbi:MAG: DNA replication and repair protein RecF [Clostridiaceae bacterium]|nr:DNA replication and repair protein RecF [Clostridiaceae bacterium]
MMIAELSLRGFRSYESASFDFRDGVNIVWGENAKGKTNLLEAIMLLSGASSWRSRKRGDFINFYKDAASMAGTVLARDRSFNISIEMPLAGKNRYEVNKVIQKRQYDLSEYLKCVLFCPDDLYLVKGGPEKRRRFMDTALCQLRPRYAAILSEYGKLMEIKQYILKEGGSVTVLPEVNDRMVYYSAELIHYRSAFLSELARESEIIHRNISKGIERLELKYKTVSTIDDSSVDTPILRDLLKKHMEEHSEAELQSRMLLSGAHKDDIDIYINGQPAKSFASQGQARTAALALKFGERELFRLDCGEYPVLLLDDVLSELDESRCGFVASSAVGGQTIITCCCPPELFEGANIIPL